MTQVSVNHAAIADHILTAKAHKKLKFKSDPGKHECRLEIIDDYYTKDPHWARFYVGDDLVALAQIWPSTLVHDESFVVSPIQGTETAKQILNRMWDAGRTTVRSIPKAIADKAGFLSGKRLEETLAHIMKTAIRDLGR